MIVKKKVVIVTGGSGLIGTSIVNRLSERDVNVINADVCVIDNIESGTIFCDVTNNLSIDRMILQVMEYYGKIDGLVNNAYPRTPDWGCKFEDVKYESWKNNVDMQLNSCFYICQKVLEIMKLQKFGSVINIASIYGVVGNDFSIYENTDGMTSPAAYSAIKGGIVNFTRYLASYYGKYNIRINTVSPGGVFNHQHQEFVKNFEKKVPLRRMGNPDDIALPICFLLSDDASYITGHNLLIDGGWTAI